MADDKKKGLAALVLMARAKKAPPKEDDGDGDEYDSSDGGSDVTPELVKCVAKLREAWDSGDDEAAAKAFQVAVMHADNDDDMG